MIKIECFQNITDTHEYLKLIGVEKFFFDATAKLTNGQHKQQAQVLTYIRNSSPCSIFVLYTLSKEIGLWVKPDLRNRYLGTHMMKFSLVNKKLIIGRYPIYARTNICSTSSGTAMRKILERSKFQKISTGTYLDLWKFYQ